MRGVGRGTPRTPRDFPGGPLELSRTICSIPHITFIPFQPINGEQPAEFILKQDRCMMALLIGDLLFHIGNVLGADRKRTVAVLPIEFTRTGFESFDPI